MVRLNIRCRNIIYNQKGPTIFGTIHTWVGQQRDLECALGVKGWRAQASVLSLGKLIRFRVQGLGFRLWGSVVSSSRHLNMGVPDLWYCIGAIR